MKPIATTRSATGIPTGRLAVWWVIASEIVIFGGLLGSYIMHRIGHPEFGTGEYAANTNPWIGAFNTWVLLSSSLSAVLAHHAAEKGDGPKAFKYLVRMPEEFQVAGLTATFRKTPQMVQSTEFAEWARNNRKLVLAAAAVDNR